MLGDYLKPSQTLGRSSKQPKILRIPPHFTSKQGEHLRIPPHFTSKQVENLRIPLHFTSKRPKWGTIEQLDLNLLWELHRDLVKTLEQTHLALNLLRESPHIELNLLRDTLKPPTSTSTLRDYQRLFAINHLSSHFKDPMTFAEFSITLSTLGSSQIYHFKPQNSLFENFIASTSAEFTREIFKIHLHLW